MVPHAKYTINKVYHNQATSVHIHFVHNYCVDFAALSAWNDTKSMLWCEIRWFIIRFLLHPSEQFNKKQWLDTWRCVEIISYPVLSRVVHVVVGCVRATIYFDTPAVHIMLHLLSSFNRCTLFKHFVNITLLSQKLNIEAFPWYKVKLKFIVLIVRIINNFPNMDFRQILAQYNSKYHYPCSTQ